jgi:hypothetical protein
VGTKTWRQSREINIQLYFALAVWLTADIPYWTNTVGSKRAG